MSNDEFDRQMNFIVEQQAQFASDILQLREVQAKTENVVARLANFTLEGFKDVNAKFELLVDSQISLTEAQARTEQSFEDLNVKFNALVNSQFDLTEAHSRSQEDSKEINLKIKALVESQRILCESLARTDQSLKSTDEKLRHLMTLAERYFSEGRNGKRDSSD